MGGDIQNIFLTLSKTVKVEIYDMGASNHRILDLFINKLYGKKWAKNIRLWRNHYFSTLKSGINHTIYNDGEC